MAVFSMAGGNPALPTYPLQRSVRLRSSASAYFNRTPASATNRKTWTWSGWVKRGALGVNLSIMGAQAAATAGTQRFNMYFAASTDTLVFSDDVINTSTSLQFITTQVFRDPSAWYHIVLAMDTTQATSTNRVKLYINGVQVTAFSTATYPALNFDTAINNNVAQYLGYYNNLGTTIFYYDGYFTETNFIDGQALTPSSFGAYNSYGVWSPAKYTGTYGTNGFYLNFQDNSSVTTTANVGIGKDSSGNGNYWTSNNISLTRYTNAVVFKGAGTNTWVAPAGVTSVSYLVVAGGGGGGSDSVQGTQAGAGGGGGVLTGTLAVTPGTSYTVTVGAGGTGGSGSGSGTQGGNSVFSSITATGGGRGAGSGAGAGGNGGSGGGGVNGSAGGTGVAGQGFAGGTGATGGFGGGGGGGGAGAAGGTINGGNGLQVTIGGVTAYYGGGGGGRNGNSPYAQGTGGLGGGGNFGDPGTANTGGGGGGGGGSGGGAGGTGIVILSYAGAPSPSDTTYDSMLDVPTLTSATNANYCTLNPLAMFATGASASNGNLKLTVTTAGGNLRPTFGATSGKYYAEFTITNIGGNSGTNFAIQTSNSSVYENPLFQAIYYVNGQTYNYSSSSFASYGASYTTGDIIGVAWDVDNKQVTFYKNNVSQGTLSGAAITPPNAVAPVSVLASTAGGTSSTIVDVNFGQRPFSYTPPTGYNSLCTYNLPDSIVTVGAQYMAATKYTGNHATNAITNTVNGFSLQPDFIWIKDRSAVTAHVLFDSVRGVGGYLSTNNTTVEDTTQNYAKLNSFNSNGFTLGASTLANDISNYSGDSFVGWQWRASNASAVTNTSGSITSQVSVNQTAGFSVVTYTGNGSANATVGHGLSVAPKMIIVKARNSSTYAWNSYHAGLTPGYYIQLNTTSAQDNSVSIFPSGGVTSSVWNTGGSPIYNNGSAVTYVAYCFAAVPGYSAFGSYTGNGSADGPFVYCGFRPRWIMIKQTNAAGFDWYITDTSRDTYNIASQYLIANGSAAEVTSGYIDLLSNGFKLRYAGGGVNASAATYIFACFAENPFKNALAR